MGFPAPPLTPTVTVSACAVVMLDEDGVTVNVGASVPVPLSATVWSELLALSVIVSVPERVPNAAGLKVRFTEQLVPAGRDPPDVGHVPPLAIVKSPLFVPEMVVAEIVKSAFPGSLTTSVCDALVVPTSCPGNAILCAPKPT